MDQERARQNTEIERLNAVLRNPGGGVRSKGAEERAVHALRAMALILNGALDDLMADCQECPKTLDRLLSLMGNIIGMIRGTVNAPVEDNVALLVAKCEDAILEMEQARGVKTKLKDLLTQSERYSKMAESMAHE